MLFAYELSTENGSCTGENDVLDLAQIRTGNEQIDSEHRVLLRRLSELERAIASRCSREIGCQFLAEFGELAVRHFENEERLLEHVHYPRLDEHRREHQALIQDLEAFAKAFTCDGHRSYDRAISFLKHWLADHLVNADRDYLPYLRHSTAAGSG